VSPAGVAAPPGVVRAWEELPAAPEGWAWRGPLLMREGAGRRWTIGRRAAWDGRWQLLIWRPGPDGREVATEMATGATVAEIVAVVRGWRR